MLVLRRLAIYMTQGARGKDMNRWHCSRYGIIMNLSCVPKILVSLCMILALSCAQTSRKLCIKFSGKRAVGFSSSRKYFITCDICFQKFRVSCDERGSAFVPSTIHRPTPASSFCHQDEPYLIFHPILRDQHIDDR